MIFFIGTTILITDNTISILILRYNLHNAPRFKENCVNLYLPLIRNSIIPAFGYGNNPKTVSISDNNTGADITIISTFPASSILDAIADSFASLQICAPNSAI